MIRHDSMRGYFAYELHEQMKVDKDIILLTGDLGYAMLDGIREDFPNKFMNCGAAEQAMMDIAVGLALAGKKPFVYSITTFLLYRPFETLRTYINHEKIPVRLIGGGRDQDYEHDGISHFSNDAKQILSPLHRIKKYWPNEKEEATEIARKMVSINEPSFISLRR